MALASAKPLSPPVSKRSIHASPVLALIPYSSDSWRNSGGDQSAGCTNVLFRCIFRVSFRGMTRCPSHRPTAEKYHPCFETGPVAASSLYGRANETMRRVYHSSVSPSKPESVPKNKQRLPFPSVVTICLVARLLR